MTRYDIASQYKWDPEDVIHMMYRKIEDPDAVLNGEGFFHLAASYADAKAIKILLEKGGRPSTIISESMENTPLHRLGDAKERNYGLGIKEGVIAECTRLLLDAKVDYLRKNVDHTTCLHYAARNAYHDMFAVFAERGLKMDMTDHSGNTPLHILCEWAGNAIRDINYSIRDLEDAKKQAIESQVGSNSQTLSERVEQCERKHTNALKESNNYLMCAKILVSAGVDKNVKNTAGQTALDFAIKSGDKRITALLEGYYTESDDPQTQLKIATGGMELYQAMENKDYEAVRAIVVLGTSPDEPAPDGMHKGMTALGIACNEWDPEGVQTILDCGADPNIKDTHGRAAIYYHFKKATPWAGDITELKPERILKLLINKGFDIDSFIDDKANTLANMAAERSDAIMAQEVIAYSADLNIANFENITPLMNICRSNNPNAESIELSFLKNSAKINIRDIHGNTPLMYAAANRNKAIGKTMAENLFKFYPPDLSAANNEGLTAIAIAAENNNESLVKFLREKQ